MHHRRPWPLSDWRGSCHSRWPTKVDPPTSQVGELCRRKVGRRRCCVVRSAATTTTIRVASRDAGLCTYARIARVRNRNGARGKAFPGHQPYPRGQRRWTKAVSCVNDAVSVSRPHPSLTVILCVYMCNVWRWEMKVCSSPVFQG